MRIAVIGDVHGHWDEADLAYFNRSDYDLLLFVGDLAKYAHAGGLRVAGHMHHALAGGGERRWRVEREGLLHVNAARTPRSFVRGEQKLRHHVLLETDGRRTTAEELLIPGS